MVDRLAAVRTSLVLAVEPQDGSDAPLTADVPFTDWHAYGIGDELLVDGLAYVVRGKYSLAYHADGRETGRSGG